MPTYEYECLKCGKRFSLVLSVSEHDKGNVRCPRCNSKRIKQILSSFYAKTSSKT